MVGKRVTKLGKGAVRREGVRIVMVMHITEPYC